MAYTQRWVERGTDRIGLQWYDDPGPDAPLVVIWPAMGVPAGFYRPFATGLRDAGSWVVVADLRGTGASTPPASRTSRYGYAELVDDVAAVLDTVAPHRSGRRLVLLGHSLGGQACLLHLARSTPTGAGIVDGSAGSTDVDGLAMVAVGLPYWRTFQDWPGRLVVLPFTQAIGAATALLRLWPGWGFGGRQARGVIRDWAYTARAGRFPRLYGVDLAAAVSAVRTPVLAVSLARDQYTPAPIVDHLVRMVPAAPVQREHYDGDADHFTWARTETGPVVDRVAEFAAKG